MFFCIGSKKSEVPISPLIGGAKGVSIFSYYYYMKHPSKSLLIRGDFIYSSNLESSTQINLEPKGRWNR